MAQREPISYSIIWRHVNQCVEQGNTAALVSIYGQLGEILPAASLEDALEVLALAPAVIPAVGQVPQVTRSDLWKMYLRKASLSGYTLRAIRKQVSNLQPDVADMVTLAWAAQVELTQYNVVELVSFAKSLPEMTRAAFSAEFNRQCGRWRTP